MNQLRQIKKRIQNNYEELLRYYPFSSIVFFGNNSKYLACIVAVAAPVDLINAINGNEEDFTGEYSKTVFLFVPHDYEKTGCAVYGCGWIDIGIIPDEDKHFFVDSVTTGHGINRKTTYTFLQTPFGYRMCVGTPESFSFYKNVLLESLKTADNLLTAYEIMMRGLSSKLTIHSYSHGFFGRKEFLDERSKNKVN